MADQPDTQKIFNAASSHTHYGLSSLQIAQQPGDVEANFLIHNFLVDQELADAGFQMGLIGFTAAQNAGYFINQNILNCPANDSQVMLKPWN